MNAHTQHIPDFPSEYNEKSKFFYMHTFGAVKARHNLSWLKRPEMMHLAWNAINELAPDISELDTEEAYELING